MGNRAFFLLDQPISQRQLNQRRYFRVRFRLIHTSGPAVTALRVSLRTRFTNTNGCQLADACMCFAAVPIPPQFARMRRLHDRFTSTNRPDQPPGKLLAPHWPSWSLRPSLSPESTSQTLFMQRQQHCCRRASIRSPDRNAAPIPIAAHLPLCRPPGNPASHRAAKIRVMWGRVEFFPGVSRARPTLRHGTIFPAGNAKPSTSDFSSPSRGSNRRQSDSPHSPSNVDQTYFAP